ncbi:putative Dol-P-Glc:Glc(2)Man(9)GlcNAc(2)-PP-Dol alpha-1,2-glucosyltransferase [Aricia agestis]|uniref:putative Dol-P-Glc:Glc(2)Man(9)GlcNAc(2)-PP-Dol alpha-1,2-glucosyltransferase n=1 Tax=Aricia agestis TaxID=91739 RepID=UPI001C20BF33|nr:putative Dol-P-Glc:Glc(2)Man(9)GlcNAc(2)-PP-Dol alpha-1,2-glucosyltransferase [Aricia agestis]XP_041968531.1 putative Dol-P-Glc:Glc(2)Man(9)GlcNAc(2)-PP-Dol alpha-1,2-glucosyltransferase [Aricia agestis]
MKLSTKYYFILLSTVGVYYVISKIVFDKIYETILIVVDELFHIPQGLTYCNGNFSHWDPKITTLPGLYLLSAPIGMYLECNSYNLRFVNLIASCLNLAIFSSILKFIYGNNTESQFKIVLQAVNLAILPPLYFFSHVYYTDTLSLTFLLIYSRLCLNNRSKIFIFIFGLCSVIMRQTNIVWVGMVLGHKLLDILIRSSRVYGNSYLTRAKVSKRSPIARDIDSSKLKRYYGLYDAFVALKYHVTTSFLTVSKFVTYQDSCVIMQQCLVLSVFAVFMFINGSIVVGDKEAHKPTIHLPQVLYFLLFYGVFGLPYVIAKLISTMKLIFSNKLLALLLGIIVAIIVHFNTTVHPYLLADNRHYVFYIWNRWFGKYDYAIYATIPAYIFLIFSLYDNLKDQNCISFLLPYSVCASVVLGLQKLVDLRYFLVPYIVLRLRFIRPSFRIVVFEFILYVLLNIVTLYIFFTKEIIWTDFVEAQRIIW